MARWLLMAHDRLGSDKLSIIHEAVSTLLGVRRPGVTVALHILEGEHKIRATRGMIRIRDREKLNFAANRSYGQAYAGRAGGGTASLRSLNRPRSGLTAALSETLT